MANDFPAQRHLLNQICVFLGPPEVERHLVKCTKQYCELPPSFPTLPVQQTQEAFY